VVCLEGEIRQVLANLISNAIDAMPGGGTLRLSVAVEAEGLRIAVSDTGEGISPDLHDHILEPFFTTKGLKGTGLGLPISAEIIARHGGRFDFGNVTIAPGAGAKFEFVLPFGRVVLPMAAAR
jgi:two-component system, NtrC family, sensor kinase